MQQIDCLNPDGWYRAKHIRRGKTIKDFVFPNAVCNTAKDSLLNVFFNSASRSSSWYAGIIDSVGFTGLDASDTLSTHPGWDEYLNYPTLFRVEWGKGTAVGKVITNASPMVFNFTTAAGIVVGIFLSDNTSKSGSSGLLWSTALFPAQLAVQPGDSLNVTYAVSC